VTRLIAFLMLLLLTLAAQAENRVRILFDDTNNSYRPRTHTASPPTDGCRPAVDDSDDNGCVTEGEDLENETDDTGVPP
jgi:hypothetical protein